MLCRENPIAYAIVHIRTGATNEASVPNTDIPPLIPCSHFLILKGSNVCFENVPIPDAAVSENASANDVIKGMMNMSFPVKIYAKEKIIAGNPLAITCI